MPQQWMGCQQLNTTSAAVALVAMQVLFRLRAPTARAMAVTSPSSSIRYVSAAEKVAAGPRMHVHTEQPRLCRSCSIHALQPSERDFEIAADRDSDAACAQGSQLETPLFELPAHRDVVANRRPLPERGIKNSAAKEKLQLPIFARLVLAAFHRLAPPASMHLISSGRSNFPRMLHCVSESPLRGLDFDKRNS